MTLATLQTIGRGGAAYELAAYHAWPSAGHRCPPNRSTVGRRGSWYRRLDTLRPGHEAKRKLQTLLSASVILPGRGILQEQGPSLRQTYLPEEGLAPLWEALHGNSDGPPWESAQYLNGAAGAEHGETHPFLFTPVAGELDLVYSDEHLLVLNKPSGLLSVPGREIKDSMVTRAAVAFGHYRLDKMVVHRLDYVTSGLIVFARSQKALVGMNEQFTQRTVRKRYIAVVHGTVHCDSGEIDIPMRKDLDDPPRQIVDWRQGKPSLTKWQVIGRDKDRTRLELSPISGRSHQLRVHMRAIGHPILGDPLYAPEPARAMSERCLLHAASISFVHPVTGAGVIFHTPCPF